VEKPASVRVNRREFIRYGMCGLTAIAAGSLAWSCGGGGSSGGTGPPAGGGGLPIDLSMEETLVEMVDLTPVYHWVFAGPGGPGFPGPAIFAASGDELAFRVTNHLDEVHEFRVLGAGQGGADVDSGPIAPGETVEVRFTAPAGGTYLYLDPRNAPVNRALGLHGAFVVLPKNARENTPVNTPYSSPTASVQRLFDDLGTAAHFPGDPWIPVRPGGVAVNPDLPPDIEPFLFRTRIWMFAQVDPAFNALAASGANAEPGGGIDPAAFLQGFLPRYFLINGRSGAFAAHGPQAKESLLEGFIGEPHLVRLLNAGVSRPSPHLHANHFYVLAVDNVVQDSAIHIDSMTLATVEDAALPGRLSLKGGSRVDWLVAFIRPPDIPGNPDVPLRTLIPEELSTVIDGVVQSPLDYPMHNHTEQSQTAAGGNYPQGGITHIVFLGDLDKVPFPT